MEMVHFGNHGYCYEGGNLGIRLNKLSPILFHFGNSHQCPYLLKLPSDVIFLREKPYFGVATVGG